MTQESTEESRPVRPDARVRDHLANERTYLAWVRTALALIGVGFVLARMGVFLQQFAMVAEKAEQPRLRGSLEFLAIGVIFLVLGTALFVGSAWLYDRARIAIDANRYEPPRHAIRWLTIVLMMGSLAIIGLVLWQLVSLGG